MKKYHSLKRLSKMTLPYFNIIFFAAVFALIVNAAQLIKPYILKIIIDDFLIGHKEEIGIYSINFMAVLYIVVIFIASFFSYSQQLLMNKASQNILFNLRKEIFKHIQHLSLSYLDKCSSGKLITRSTNDVEALNEFFTTVLISLFKDIFLLIGIIFMMLKLDVKLAFISFTLVPIIIIITFFTKNMINENFRKIKSIIGKINGFFAENIAGIRLVRIFHCEKEKIKEFKELNKAYLNSTELQIKLNSLLGPVIEVLETASISILIWYSMGGIKNGILHLGILYAFTNYIKQFFGPISEIADNYTTIQSALVSADRIFELLDEKDSLENIEVGLNIDSFKGNIEFKNVWFSYNDNDWILKDVSFKISAGETAALVGSTGSGKTTILSLLSRFYEIQKGEIFIDGINIKDISLKSLRKNIAIVLQDVFLFSGNIENNITLNSRISSETALNALRLSCADSFVSELPDKIHEKVNEGGNTFSAGQRQLLSFARAIAHNPSILVMDEATANIDTNTELLLQKSIENISKSRTTLIVAHRLSTIRNADKIIVLDKGCIMEIGNHDMLLKNGTYYKSLYEAQYS